MITVFLYVWGEIEIRTGRCNSQTRNRDGSHTVASAPLSNLTIGPDDRTRLTQPSVFLLLNTVGMNETRYIPCLAEGFLTTGMR